MDENGNVRVLLNGADGRMGEEVLTAIKLTDGIILGAGLCGEKSSAFRENLLLHYLDIFLYLKEKEVPSIRETVDVIIDFSIPEAVINLLREAHLPAVIGVTGFSEKQLEMIRGFSKEVPIVQDYNFSTGVCILTAVVENIARIFGLGYDGDVLEIHHSMKADAPSGTAIKLAKAIAKGRGQNYEEVVKMSRVGKTGVRPVGEIGIQSLRLAGVVGEHTVYLGGSNERLELTHKAGSRAVFAEGAVAAAKWVVNQRPGLYTMRDVLGL
ncbi:MAG: Dihydrodipicolinate reductase [uncultured bacterium]|nr:MAG: Dihydrodipicolinate reductase [uncultured bacterium]